MLNAVIRFSLRFRTLVAALALLVCGYGTWVALRTPIDVFPDLNRPRVVVMTEAPGMSPEEVESLISFPIETALNGANGVETVRSSSGAGISVIYVEFAFDTDIFIDRQVVNERLQVMQGRLPAGIQPQLAPISSIMGQILMLGVYSESNATDPLEMRTLADWVVRQRLLTVPGVAQVFTMGGGRKQFQVLVRPSSLLDYGVTLDQVKQAVIDSNGNATGGYLDQQGPNELLVRSLGRVQSTDDLERVVVTIRGGRPVTLAQVADVVEGAQVKRGDSAAYVKETHDGHTHWSGGPAVVLTINKQPGADTRQVTQDVTRAIAELKPTLPSDLQIISLYAQESFIDRAIENVAAALRDGVILVVIILVLFLMNIRTTFITLTAIPLSLLTTAIVFAATGMSINTMTLGGLAVALGELVDDAIVDVENIFRRLRQNRTAAEPKPTLLVVYQASKEVRNSIVFSTIIVCLVFIPLFALGGMEGRLFRPLGIAYIVSIAASLLVSLTVTPVLSYWLLGRSRLTDHAADSFILQWLKHLFGAIIRFSLRFPVLNLAAVVLGVAVAMYGVWQLERDFLPPFNEGSIQLNVILPPGTSLSVSNEIATRCERRLQQIDDVIRIGRRTGRAELDEHAEGVNASEFIIDLDPNSHQSREAQIDEIREAMADIPGVASAVEQPISHLISHMLSGVKAQIGIKLYGDDLDVLRRHGQQMEQAIKSIAGVRDVMLEPQVLIPQLRIELRRDKLMLNGLSAQSVNDMIQTALNGATVSQVLVGQRTFDLVVRFNNESRENLDAIRRLSIDLPEGGVVPLEEVADIYESAGPNTINREDVRRRIVLQCNVADRGVVDVVHDIEEQLTPILNSLPSGYFVEYGGQFQSQQEASRVLGGLFIFAMLGVFLSLFTMFGSVNLSLQVMAALPMAFIGSVAALYLTGQTLTIAAMVGFISLTGIASRNGILLLNHYLHLVKYEGEDWSQAMIVRAGLERLAPVLMTALTAGIGLVPLVLAAGEPGKEILYPVATVILGGVISSTLLDFFVHPALFWLFGIREAQRVVSDKAEAMSLADNSPLAAEGSTE
ncbi:MAG: efflux RND transporter permease subunit [Planctomycetales bacterium]|nr:efflux RND transporter permease subunit [Planctomycetales bacterium]